MVAHNQLSMQMMYKGMMIQITIVALVHVGQNSTISEGLKQLGRKLTELLKLIALAIAPSTLQGMKKSQSVKRSCFSLWELMQIILKDLQ
jgi:hypothetical protein